MNNLTDNINLFQPTGFKISIDRRNYANLEFFVQTVNLPGLNIPPAEIPFSRINTVPLPGDKLTYGELSVTILLDEDLNSFIEMYNWMLRLINEPFTGAYDALNNGTISSNADITLTMLTSHNNANKRFRYVDAIPVSMGDIQMEASNASVEYTVLPVSFRYSYFEII